MAVRFSCKCGKKLKAADEFIGKKVLCSKCGETVKVPDVDEAPAAKKKKKSSFAPADQEERKLFTTAKHKPGGQSDTHSSAASSANIADQMLHQTTAKAEKASADDYGTPQPKKKEKAGKKKFDTSKMIGADIDIKGTFTQYSKQIIPGAVAVVLLSLLLYYVSSKMFATDEGYPDLGEVSGFVTLNDAPLPDADIVFIPQDDWKDGKKPASSVGRTDEQGRFTLIYTQDVKGAAVGKHKVRITSTKMAVPIIYNVNTVLSFEVKPGSNKEAAFQLSTKK